MSATTHEAALAALRLAEADPRRSVAVATDVVRAARSRHDLAAASVAQRALGVAALHLQDTTAAVRHLRLGVRLGQQAGRPDLVHETRLRLAAVLNLAGRPRAALVQIDAALEDVTGTERSRVWAQRGAIELQLDHLDEAAADLERALPGLRAAGDRMWLKRVLANRGLVHARRGRFVAAEADLLEALHLNQELGIELSVAFIEQNLGWVHTLAGDVPRALDRLDRAEDTLRRLGAQVGFLLEDRARLLLSVGLVGEATRTAEEAVAALERERQTVAVPDVRLLLARAALLDGRHDQAIDQARRSARELRRLGRRESVAQAQLVVLTALAGAGRPSAISLPRLRAVADTLAESGWQAEAIEARALVASIEERRSVGDRGRGQLLAAAASRRRGPSHVRAMSWHAEARLRRARGRSDSALVALRAGLRVLDEQRAGLGGSDLRASTGRRRTLLAAEGLSIAVESGLVGTILPWAEHGRASQFLLPSVVPEEDAVLVDGLARLRAAYAEVDAARAGGLNPTRALHRLAAAEQQVRRQARRQAGRQTRVRRPVTVAELSARLGEAALVEYVELDGALFAIVVVAGAASWVPLGAAEVTAALAERLPFALRRLALGRSEDAVRRLLGDTARRLDDLLLGPLATRLGRRPLVVVPTGHLQSLPWSLLPSCHGRAVTVSPSATSWWVASQRVATAGHAVSVAGPGLAGAEREARQVAGLYDCAELTGDSATAAGVLSAMRGAGVAHLAAHGRLHPEHPLFSSLILADGPLTGYDLERLHPPPALVVLSACESGRNDVTVGDEVLGLTASLLGRGVRCVVAPVVLIRDAETEPLMTAFHRLLLSGAAADAALAGAQRVVDPLLSAAFVCVGGAFALPKDGAARE